MAFAMTQRSGAGGAETKHFNVGQYRRKQNEEKDVQDASFFDRNNPVRPHAPHPPAPTPRACPWFALQILNPLLREMQLQEATWLVFVCGARAASAEFGT